MLQPLVIIDRNPILHLHRRLHLDGSLRGSIRHAHHLLGDGIGFLLVLIACQANCELSLNFAP
jgi:hypothetical protein